MYTPEQIAELLQLSKNTVYELIKQGEIVAKRYGKVFRIPASSVSFALTGLDFDLYQAEAEDQKNLTKVEETIKEARTKVWVK